LMLSPLSCRIAGCQDPYCQDFYQLVFHLENCHQNILSSDCSELHTCQWLNCGIQVPSTEMYTHLFLHAYHCFLMQKGLKEIESKNLNKILVCSEKQSPSFNRIFNIENKCRWMQDG
ncbi:MAG: hypothetical protein MHPSP_004664, partial [Paramarteilia canceri]